MPQTDPSFFSPTGPLASTLEGYEERPAQQEMATAVEACIQSPTGRLLVEAGTGVGKSLAYLAPILIHGGRAVVATGTKALQEQLAHDDLPLLSRALAVWGVEPPEVAVVKGRHNYLCHLRFERVAAGIGLFEGRRAKQIEALDDWRRRTESGDRTELASVAEGRGLWDDIDAGAETCVGARCPHRDRCFVVRNRERARAADLIITNHHLLMADEALRLARRFGDVPDHAELLPEHDILVVDEAHGLPDVATDAFSAAVTTFQIDRLVRDTRTAAQSLPEEDRATVEARAEGAATATRVAIEALAGPRANGPTTLPPLPADAPERGIVERGLEAMARLGDAVVAGPLEPSIAEALSLRCQRLGRALSFLAEADDPTFVYFGERRRANLRVVAAPIEVSTPLAETLFREGRQVVLTSATLATDRGFGPVRRVLGLAESDAVVERQIPSPFPFPELVRYYLPAAPIIPEGPDHLTRLASEMEALCHASGGGVFLLFTSHRVLDSTFQAISPRLPFPVLRQGEAPRRALLELFRGSGNAVLFGTHSFWEGVDVRGPALRLVAIDRLPFASPADPLFAARQRLLRSRGEKPFTALALPQAILELKQGVGRLVRSSTDRGVIALLDGRIQTKGYGRRFLAALPEAPRLKELTEVEAFFRVSA